MGDRTGMDSMALFDTDLSVNPDAIAPPAPTAAATPAPAPSPVLGETVLAVDGNSLAHRAYHAYGNRPEVTNPVGAGLYGFLALLAAVVDLVRPAATIIGFDCRTSSFRKDLFSEYKGQRPEKPDALDALLDEIPVALDELGAAVRTEQGYEADDICGSVAGASKQSGRHCVVATSDRDAFGLVGDGVEVLRIRSGMHRAQQYTARRFRRELGITPGQYTEYAALRGDSSDNLPGIHGIGPKRARDLLRRFDTVADAVADPLGCRSVLGPEVGQVLIDDHASSDSVFHRNVQLMTIVQDLDVDLDDGLPTTPPTVIDECLRERRLAGLIGRMTLCFADTAPNAQAPPLTDADVPSLEVE
ncbi:5'-3' exonuclease [Euzebya tangerina]|uniref:5'-3' exonuclease n=1 Tax=Euzebya tangerina TaxID=591198 RepID=UPI000E316DEF|nr:5'-3' exonuclease H3TH domain-containing protein [Euzebya tangerina]